MVRVDDTWTLATCVDGLIGLVAVPLQPNVWVVQLCIPNPNWTPVEVLHLNSSWCWITSDRGPLIGALGCIPSEGIFIISLQHSSPWTILKKIVDHIPSDATEDYGLENIVASPENKKGGEKNEWIASEVDRQVALVLENENTDLLQALNGGNGVVLEQVSVC